MFALIIVSGQNSTPFCIRKHGPHTIPNPLNVDIVHAESKTSRGKPRIHRHKVTQDKPVRRYRPGTIALYDVGDTNDEREVRISFPRFVSKSQKR